MADKNQAKKTRKMVEVERPVMVEFDTIGKVVEGTLVGIQDGITQYGEARFLQIKTDDDQNLSVCMSSSMALIEWDDLVGLYVSIEYTGDEKSKNNKGKTYKTFKVQHEQV